MDTVLIFGGCGFIGSHYAVHCLKNLSVRKVILADIVPPDVNRTTLDFKRYFEEGSIEFVFCDVRQEISLTLSDSIAFIANFAAVHTTPGHEPNEYYETNISGAIHVCKLADRIGVKQIVFTSSISVYGPDESQKDEFSTLCPTSSYGFSKMLSEKIHLSWLEKSASNKLVVIRPAVVFGPGERGNFTRLANMLSRGIFIYPGRKDTIKACIYVSDLIYLIELARNSDRNFELLNGAYRERYTLENIVETFREGHFSDAKVYLLPKAFIFFVAKILGFFNFLNIGIHPERVTKLVKSTNIYPSWVDNNSVVIPGTLKTALSRWSKETDGKFS